MISFFDMPEHHARITGIYDPVLPANWLEALLDCLAPRKIGDFQGIGFFVDPLLEANTFEIRDSRGVVVGRFKVKG